jgi:hypothetical protein
MTTTAAHRLLDTVTATATAAESVYGYRRGTIASPLGEITLRLTPRQGYRSMGAGSRRDAVSQTWELNGKRIAHAKLIAALVAA